MERRTIPGPAISRATAGVLMAGMTLTACSNSGSEVGPTPTHHEKAAHDHCEVTHIVANPNHDRDVLELGRVVMTRGPDIKKVTYQWGDDSTLTRQPGAIISHDFAREHNTQHYRISVHAHVAEQGEVHIVTCQPALEYTVHPNGNGSVHRID